MSHAHAGHRNPATARNDVLCLLRYDHDRVLGEFREFDRLQSQEATQACQRVVQRTLAELKVIAGVEQQLFYPALRPALQGTDLIDQSEIEHVCIKRLIDQLEVAEPTQPKYMSRFRVLGEYVRRHVADEEQELYTVLPQVPIDWQRLHEAMRLRRAELAEDFGIAHLQTASRVREAEPPRDVEADEETFDALVQA